jgi:hypothetical protein
MDASVKTRLIRTVAAMIVEAVVLVVVVFALILGRSAIVAGTLPLVLGALVFVAISFAILAGLGPKLAALGGAETQATGWRGTLATFVLGYAGNGAVHAALHIRDIVTNPYDWADIAILNTFSKALVVAAEWPTTLATLVGYWVG